MYNNWLKCGSGLSSDITYFKIVATREAVFLFLDDLFFSLSILHTGEKKKIEGNHRSVHQETSMVFVAVLNYLQFQWQ